MDEGRHVPLHIVLRFTQPHLRRQLALAAMFVFAKLLPVVPAATRVERTEGFREIEHGTHDMAWRCADVFFMPAIQAVELNTSESARRGRRSSTCRLDFVVSLIEERLGDRNLESASHDEVEVSGLTSPPEPMNSTQSNT